MPPPTVLKFRHRAKLRDNPTPRGAVSGPRILRAMQRHARHRGGLAGQRSALLRAASEPRLLSKDAVNQGSATIASGSRRPRTYRENHGWSLPAHPSPDSAPRTGIAGNASPTCTNCTSLGFRASSLPQQLQPLRLRQLLPPLSRANCMCVLERLALYTLSGL